MVAEEGGGECEVTMYEDMQLLENDGWDPRSVLWVCFGEFSVILTVDF